MATQNPTISPQQADPLAQLRDIHLPSPIELWPPAPGWFVLAIFAFLALLAAAVWLYVRWRREQYRRDAVSELEGLLAQYWKEQDTQAYLNQCANLLKRVALTRYQRTDVASLTGEAWVRFLDRTAGTQEFTMGAGQALIQGSYEKDPEIAVEALHKAARYWIKQHTGRLEQAA